MRFPEALSGIVRLAEGFVESSEGISSASSVKPKIRQVDRVIGHREEHRIHENQQREHTVYQNLSFQKPEPEKPTPEVNTNEIP